MVIETRGFHHDSIPAAKAMIGSLGYRTAYVEARQLTARRLRHARAIVFLNTSGELRLDAAGTRRLLAFVWLVADGLRWAMQRSRVRSVAAT